MIVPPAYLDKLAMFDHQFLDEQFLRYRLIYDRRNVVPVTLPAPYLFDYQAIGRYVITREEATEYERGMEAARQHDAAHEAIASASRYNPIFTYGYQPGGPWYQTNLGQKPKLGGVRISHRLYIHVHTLFQSWVLILFHCIIHASLFSFLCFLLVCLINLKKKQKNQLQLLASFNFHACSSN